MSNQAAPGAAACKITGKTELPAGTATDLVLANQPRYIDRKAGADLISRLYFRVAPRTLESWPLRTRQINGRAHNETAELLAYARQKLDAAPAPRLGGRRPKV